MSDLTTKILVEIRDEIRGTNQRLDQTNQRVDRLHQRQVETEVRLSTELVSLAAAVHEVRDAVIEQNAFGARIANHEERLSRLERGVP